MAHKRLGREEIAMFRLVCDAPSFIDPRSEIAWQTRLEPISDVRDGGMMDIAPLPLQVGGHAGEWTFHGR
jgi:hypothetical protein